MIERAKDLVANLWIAFLILAVVCIVIHAIIRQHERAQLAGAVLAAVVTVWAGGRVLKV